MSIPSSSTTSTTVMYSINTITVVTPIYEDVTDLLSYNVGTKIFTVSSGYQSYTWFIDGVKQVNATDVFVVDADELEVGVHNMAVHVSDSNGSLYTAEYEFEVRKIL